MKPRPAWLRVHRGGRDFDQGGRDWLRRSCRSSPRPERQGRRLRSPRWSRLGRRFRRGRLIAFAAAMAAGAVALFSPSLAFFALPSFMPTSAAAGQIAGYARVIDGDTIDIDGTRIRLHGIDAPELSQWCGRNGAPVYPCGEDAKAALERIIGGAKVACEPRDHDRYGRTIGACVAHGLDVGREMVRQGWAVAYTRYSLAYVADEVAARAAKRALWAGDFESPEEWRQHHGRH
jgi:endonuclease YncB( thermonuclease family)